MCLGARSDEKALVITGRCVPSQAMKSGGCNDAEDVDRTEGVFEDKAAPNSQNLSLKH